MVTTTIRYTMKRRTQFTLYIAAIGQRGNGCLLKKLFVTAQSPDLAGTLQQSFRQAQRRGLPLPILWVADYFTWDGEGLRFGRYYRTAVVRYGAYFTILTGVLQLLACLLWTVIRNPYQLEIPFEEKVLSLHYGINYWLTLSLGLLSTTLGLLVAFLDLRYPDEIALFFGIDPLADYEEYHLTASELECVYNKGKSTDINLVEIPVADTPSEIIAPQTQVILKRRTTVRLGQRSLFRSPAMVVTTPEENNELPLYLNVPQSRNPPHVEMHDDRTYLNF
uniref:Uncharacterized protein n=1 Tax=Timema cristinae TaxID=61476 RepID=A0A7R9CLS9_TIMCR|nr:unnamed protein product [Timema cristinae]